MTDRSFKGRMFRFLITRLVIAFFTLLMLVALYGWNILSF